MSKMHNPAHPGELLRERIPEGMTVTEAAAQLGVPRAILSRILNSNALVTAEMALRLSIWLDTTSKVWLNMHGAWDLWQAEQQGFPSIKPLRLASC